MFFVLSKIFFLLLRPSAIFTLLVLVGVVLVHLRRTERWGRRALLLAAAILLVCGATPVADLATAALEDRFPRQAPPGDIAGIILLGGYENADIAAGRGVLSINDRAERLTEAVVLARRYPAAPIVVTGGSVSLLTGTPIDAAAPVGRYLREVGIAPERILLEGRSRSTYENAQATRVLVDPRPGKPYLLVTSAMHIPRAMGIFRHQGFDVFAWPVDYRTAGAHVDWSLADNLLGNLGRLDNAFKEWAGLLAYRLVGRTDELLPAPGAGDRPAVDARAAR